MGFLRIPDSGPIYVDTQILIYSIEQHPVYLPLLHDFWKAVESREVTIHMSELLYLEALVMPMKTKNSTVISYYERFLERDIVNVHPISKELLIEAARLRAETPALRTPDAIHAATALSFAAGKMLSNDRVFAKVRELDVVNLFAG